MVIRIWRLRSIIMNEVGSVLGHFLFIFKVIRDTIEKVKAAGINVGGDLDILKLIDIYTDIIVKKMADKFQLSQRQTLDMG